MPRVTIQLPASLPFRTELPLLISQINHAGHLDNAQVLVLVSEARQRFLRWMGYRSETDIEGLGIILALYRNKDTINVDEMDVLKS